MAIALRSTTTAATTVPGTTVDVPKPAGLADGDVVIITVGAATDGGGGSTIGFAVPTFTQIVGSTRAGSVAYNGCSFYKVITNAAGEPASWTVTVTPGSAFTLNIVAGASAWTGVDTGSPIDAGAVNQAQTSLSVIAPTLTTVTNGAMLVFHGMNRRALTYTPDAAMSEDYDHASTGGAVGTIASEELAHELRATAGATGTRTATLSGASARENQGTLFALRPSSGPPPTSNAGVDQSVQPGEAVSLTGTAAPPAGGSVTSTVWTQVSGTAVTLTGGTTLTPSFTAPTTVDEHAIVLRLTVTANTGTTATDDVTVNVAAAPYLMRRESGAWVRRKLLRRVAGAWVWP